MEYIKAGVSDWNDDGQIKDFLRRILNREEGDGSGLIYGMGHAVYTKSDPRAVILKRNAEQLAEARGLDKEFELLKRVERLAPEVFYEVKGDKKPICANVDFYSGFVYKMLRLPPELFTPLFAVARMPGWCAHRIEEILTGGRIMRPAYKALMTPRAYIPLDQQMCIRDSTIPESLDYTGMFEDLFDRYTCSHELLSVRTTDMGSLFKLHYRIVLKDVSKEKEFMDELRCRNGNLEISCGRVAVSREDL